eukprot:6062215-Lingulodinium_polyedra.AAC.1
MSRPRGHDMNSDTWMVFVVFGARGQRSKLGGNWQFLRTPASLREHENGRAGVVCAAQPENGAGYDLK